MNITHQSSFNQSTHLVEWNCFLLWNLDVSLIVDLTHQCLLEVLMPLRIWHGPCPTRRWHRVQILHCRCPWILRWKVPSWPLSHRWFQKYYLFSLCPIKHAIVNYSLSFCSIYVSALGPLESNISGFLPLIILLMTSHQQCRVS